VYEVLNKFALCETCIRRQGEGQQLGMVRPKDCFICEGLTSKIDSLSKKVLRSVRRYEFSTFSIGVILPSGVQEREDEVRSELRMRGRETIKSEISREVSRFAIKVTRKKVDKLRPDLTALIDMGSQSVQLATKPLFIHGRYTKPEGIAQRRGFCERCNGRGCEVCVNTGYSQEPSVESILASKLGRLMGSTRMKFTWLGSEDVESKVFSPGGRPFIVELKSPEKRTPPRHLVLRTGKGGLVRVSSLKALAGRPTKIPSFVFTTIAKIESPQRISKENLRRLRREMKMARVQFHTSKGRLVYKTVYSVRARTVGDGTAMIAEIKMDGGLPVKKLVSGESVSPSLSELLNVPLRCTKFDIVKVWEVGSFAF
jgi:tRNA pseudouridine synthase 10